MTRRDEIEEEIERFATWRRRNFDDSETYAHLAYAARLVNRKEEILEDIMFRFDPSHFGEIGSEDLREELKKLK